MRTVLPIVLFGLAGILAGGVVSMVKQKASPLPIVILSVLALLAAAGGVLWLLPEG